MSMLALWLANHPWRGIWHDGLLYAVQALRRLYPGNFRNDLYFLHGSQDAFTIFSPLYAATIDSFGLQSATFVLLFAGHLLWAGAAAFLLAAVLRGFHFWLGLAMLFIWPSDYGPVPGLLNFAETFLTPRLFAEGFGMLALGWVLRGRWKWAVMPAGLALALHPLMALGPVLVGVLLMAWGNWRVLCAVAGAGAALLAAAVIAGIPPFDRLLLSMDAEWLAVVSRRAPMVLWSAWQTQEWLSRTAVAFGLVMTAGSLAQGAAARLFRSAAIVGAIGLLASWAGSGISSNLLLIQVQPWRMLWITQLCSWVALAWLISGYWQRGRLMRFLLLALCLAALTRNSLGGAVALLAGCAIWFQSQRPERSWPAWGNLAALTCLAGLVAAWMLDISRTATRAISVLEFREPLVQAFVWVRSAFDLGGSAVCGTVLLILVWQWGNSQRKALNLAAFALAFSGLLLAFIYAAYPSHGQYDLSPGGKRAVQASFAPLIAPQAVVYWQNNVAVSWLQLKRSNYASSVQLAGVAFNRGTAIEGMRRMERLHRLGGEDSIASFSSFEARILARQLPPASLPALESACEDPVLDFVVLATPLGRGVIAQARDAQFNKTYYLYDCRQLRARPGVKR